MTAETVQEALRGDDEPGTEVRAAAMAWIFALIRTVSAPISWPLRIERPRRRASLQAQEQLFLATETAVFVAFSSEGEGEMEREREREGEVEGGREGDGEGGREGGTKAISRSVYLHSHKPILSARIRCDLHVLQELRSSPMCQEIDRSLKTFCAQ